MLQNYDDKDLAMVSITILVIIGSFIITDPTPIIMGGITAIAALATGRKKEGEK